MIDDTHSTTEHGSDIDPPKPKKSKPRHFPCSNCQPFVWRQAPFANVDPAYPRHRAVAGVSRGEAWCLCVARILGQQELQLQAPARELLTPSFIITSLLLFSPHFTSSPRSVWPLPHILHQRIVSALISTACRKRGKPNHKANATTPGLSFQHVVLTRECHHNCPYIHHATRANILTSISITVWRWL